MRAKLLPCEKTPDNQTQENAPGQFKKRESAFSFFRPDFFGITHCINNIGNSKNYKRGKKHEAKQPQEIILRFFIEK